MALFDSTGAGVVAAVWVTVTSFGHRQQRARRLAASATADSGRDTQA